jgi:proliferating cell nuclear antigen
MRFFLNQVSKAEIFTAIIHNLKTFTETVNIQFTDAGLYVQTMDNSHISVIELNIPAGWFNDYKCEESVVLGIHIGLLSKILATRDKSQSLTIETSTDNEDKLEIHFTTSILIPEPILENVVIVSEPMKVKVKKSVYLEKKPAVKVYDTHFAIPLIDIESEQIDIPPTDYAAEFSLSSVNFSNIVSQLKLFGDTMTIECSEEKIVLLAHGIESGKMSVDINIDELTEFSINEGQTMQIAFALNYLNNICGFHKVAKEVELKVLDENPLCAMYHLDNGGTIKFYLAPKITDDE